MSDIIFSNQQVNQALVEMSESIATSEKVYLVGIHSGGADVADTLQQRLKNADCQVIRGNLDISFYRDDLDTIGPNPQIRSTDLPFDVTGKHIWLVDDVLYTGRTIRAAMGEIFDYGRPASVHLAVLIDRGGRELPIAADVTGLKYPAAEDCSVKLVRGNQWHVELHHVGESEAVTTGES